MKRVEFIESNDILKIVILMKGSLYRNFPLLLFSLLMLSCGIVLDIILFIGIFRHLYTSLLLYIMGLFLLASGIYFLIIFLFDIFGKEILIIDNHTAILSYKKEMFGIGIPRNIAYNEISSFGVLDTTIKELTIRYDTWERCTFEYNGKQKKFGYLTNDKDAVEMINKITSFMN
jgi:hypothetical protein